MTETEPFDIVFLKSENTENPKYYFYRNSDYVSDFEGSRLKSFWQKPNKNRISVRG